MTFLGNQTDTKLLIEIEVLKNAAFNRISFYLFRFSSLLCNVTLTWHAFGNICLCIIISMHWIIFNYTLIFIYLFAWQIQRKYGFRWWKCIFSLWQLTNKMALAKIWIISYTCNSFLLCFIRHFPHWSILEE